MILADYYGILGLQAYSSVDDIKKAYRQSARLYHPDINHSPDAEDKFILATEAYEFLLSYHDKIRQNEADFADAMEDWRKYREESSRRRARAYARSSYINFRKTRLYKTTRIFDLTTIIFSMVISVIIILYTIIGYIYRLGHPIPLEEKPSLSGFFMLLILGMIFFIVSFIFLKSYLASSKKSKCKKQ